MNIPSNAITLNQYTLGKEFVYLTSNKEYTGYYYIVSDRYFAGKSFNINSPEIIKINSDKVNIFLTKPSTYTYGLLTKVKINKTRVNSITFNPTDEDIERGFKVRYFIKQLNVTPILIREVKKDNFEELQSNSIYQTIQIDYYFNSTEEELNEIDKRMPGLKAYLSTDTLQTSSENDGL
jgi:hypothetical protein